MSSSRNDASKQLEEMKARVEKMRAAAEKKKAELEVKKKELAARIAGLPKETVDLLKKKADLAVKKAELEQRKAELEQQDAAFKLRLLQGAVLNSKNDKLEQAKKDLSAKVPKDFLDLFNFDKVYENLKQYTKSKNIPHESRVAALESVTAIISIISQNVDKLAAEAGGLEKAIELLAVDWKDSILAENISASRYKDAAKDVAKLFAEPAAELTTQVGKQELSQRNEQTNHKPLTRKRGMFNLLNPWQNKWPQKTIPMDNSGNDLKEGSKSAKDHPNNKRSWWKR